MKLCVIGAGYVGLALSLELGKYFDTICYDINANKIKNLKKNIDLTSEFTKKELMRSKFLQFSNKKKELDGDVFFITVGTPINELNLPDLTAITEATKLVGSVLKKGSIVVYESTVYPGVTEELCAPLLEKSSGLNYLKDFHLGYSPERINPGDKKMTISKIKKIISADSDYALKILKNIYSTIIKAGIHIAPSIKVAEAAKLIENTQRDINIALINELSIIFDKMNINTKAVLDAAATKWNFIKLQPGLVGGHCISVDPYYLTYKSETLGYVPTLIHSGRKINEFMPIHIMNKIDRYNIIYKKILILGFSFKANCSDIRNTKVFNLYNEANRRGYKVNIFDPLINPSEVSKEYGLKLSKTVNLKNYPIIIYAVNHKNLFDLVSKNHKNLKEHAVFFDITNSFSNINFSMNQITYLSL